MTKGPGSNVSYYADLPAYFSQLLFLWLSFILLPCSKPKGKPKFRYTEGMMEDTKEESACCCCSFSSQRGGRLKGFLIYDIITFAISVGVFLAIYFGGESQQEWQIKTTFYFCKVIYGLLSFPFLIFAVPGMQLILTRSRPTAYDKYNFIITNLI
jgi:hypothetical protein